MASDDDLTGDDVAGAGPAGRAGGAPGPYAALAARLREAHRAVAALPSTARAPMMRRLIAITAVAKRDHALAAARLERFCADLGAGPADPPTR